MLKLRGCKGNYRYTGELYGAFRRRRGAKLKRLEELIAEDMGFDGCVPVSGQTYSRKMDAYFLSVLSGFAQSAYKFSNDLRMLAIL